MFITINLKNLFVPAVLIIVVIAIILLISSGPASETMLGASGNAESCSSVLIIDAGHGGEDGGAQSKSGLLESSVNLDIALRLEALAGLMGVDTIMTRTSEEIDYPESANTTHARKTYDQNRRLELINSTPNAVLISIHQNKFPNPIPRGSQVMYAKTEGSKELGELAHANLIAALYPENRRVAIPVYDSIFLFNNINCTGILVECGFLSNPVEAELLATDEYRIKLASVLLCSYLQYMEEAS
ncbi:MAG TPA: N-acetylmuramoyl-L-alanine amidase [Clostridiales bacterium]|nr:N-acetylmuramoyl-L-alanine amidase [Clostridiales bacterium]